MKAKKAIRIFEKIRDLPYGTSGSDEVWSCYQKCVLLKQELQHIGITSQLLIGVFNWQDLPIPEHTLNLRRQRHERHVILRVFIDGSTYNIDPSIDIGLAPTLPIAHWDSTSNTATMVSLKHLRIYRPHSLHERILSRLRRNLFRDNPKEFYTEIDKWLADTRAHQLS